MQGFLDTIASFVDKLTNRYGLPDVHMGFVDFVEILIISFLFYHI